MRKLIIALGALPLIFVPTFAAAIVYMAIDDGKPSVCYGDAVNGRLENAKRLPYSGVNYRAYHIGGFLSGRTFMHSAVRDTLRDAYAALAASDPGLRFVYAESGWPWGGRLRPHRTHANGTAVDFMVPVRDGAGQVRELTGSVTNMLGYGIRFDDNGKREGLTIDFEAMAKHIIALDAAAKAHGTRIGRVILEPPLLRHLFATPTGHALQGRVTFMKTHAWFRHDQHYHVDFIVACKSNGRK